MEAEQLSLFQATYPHYKIDKPIRLIELFGGIGAQARALEYLGANFESHRVVEWSTKSIIGYNAIHKQDWNDYAKDMSVEDLIEACKGVSSNYNSPLSENSLRRLGKAKLGAIYNSMKAIHDLKPDISKVHACDLGIEREYCYIMTYSFPCQDLSQAGRREGMGRDTNTRSGLLWQVERILNELSQTHSLPQVLLMENVPQVCSDKNAHDWESWLQALERLGYTNYFDILNAKDYGLPQFRKRCFCVSILGEYSYEFPKPFKLKHKLGEFLEKGNVGKYYLTERQIATYSVDNSFGRKKLFKQSQMTKEATYSHTITVKEGLRVPGTFIKDEKGIRRLTPYECGKLMGFKKQDFKRMREAGLSENTLIHSAGDSIAVSVLMAIFGKLLGKNDKEIEYAIEGIARSISSDEERT